MKPIVVGVYGVNCGDAPSAGVAALEALGGVKGIRRVALSSSATATGNWLPDAYDASFLVPDPREGRGKPFLEALQRLRRREGLSVLLPGESGAVGPLADLATKLEKEGIRVAAADPLLLPRVARGALEATCDSAGVRWCGEAIVDAHDHTALRECAFPCLAGPAEEGKELHIRSEAELEAALRQAEREGTLPWGVRVDGDRDEWSVALVADGETVVAGAVRVLVRGDDRSAWAAMSVEAPEAVEAATELTLSLRWRGPLEVELASRNGEPPSVTRCIPRLPTWSVLAAKAGRNLPLAAVRVAIGEALARGTWTAGLLGVHTTEDFAVTREEFAAFAAEGHRRTDKH